VTSEINAGGPAESAGAGRLTRHKLPDRLFHWVNAVAVLTLLGTAFLPIAGLKFPWLDAHWIAGVVMIALVLFHAVRALFWQDWRSMGLGLRDIRGAAQSVRWTLRTRREAPDAPGKYPLLQKLFHHFMALVILTAIATGGLMLAKIDTPFWNRDPYFISDKIWGVVYVLHGLAAMTVLALLVIHIYFALRPEKLWITRSMIRGWITGREYDDNFDPEQWQPGEGS
jgi:formate dehydrogenase subunit gamma